MSKPTEVGDRWNNVPLDELLKLYGLDKAPKIWTVQRLAEFLEVSPDLVRDRCIAGSIRSITLGNRRRIPLLEVLRIVSLD